MSFSLFQLVPAVYRLRDKQLAATMAMLSSEEQSELNQLHNSSTPLTQDEQARLSDLSAKSTRGPLESLLMVIDEQLKYFAVDLDQLYENQFIETCAPWVIPYIGDLIGYQSIRGIAPSVDDPRSEVGNTISMRRRKGTVLVLEQLARDVTGWGAHAVEFWQTLGETQYVKCVRPRSYYAPSMRGWKPRAFANSGFGSMPRKLDVHNPASPGLPRPNVKSIGIFLWSLNAYCLTDIVPVQAVDSGVAVPNCFRFDPLGCDVPIFHAAVYQGEQVRVAATEANVPDFLTRPELCADLRKGASASYYGIGASLSLTLNRQLLNPYQIQVADLSGSDGSWSNMPAANGPYAAAIDPDMGRIALSSSAAGASPTLTASYYYGFNAEMGGGEYSRIDGFQVTDEKAIFPFPDTASPKRYNNLQDAFTFVAGQANTLGKVALEIYGSSTIAGPIAPLTIDVPSGATVEIRARDGARPLLLLSAEIQATGDEFTQLIVNGLVIAAASGVAPSAGGPEALIVLPATGTGGDNKLASLQLTHTTLVPGWSLDSSGAPTQKDAPAIVAHTSGGQIAIEQSIVGPIRAGELVSVGASDSIIDATRRSLVAYCAPDETGGGPLTLDGSTVVGRVHAQELALVSNSIVWAVGGTGWISGLISDRAQVGCVRFSFLPWNAVTPRRFECVEQALAGPAPVFLSYRYGQPDYLKLMASTPAQVRAGADDGGEMGAFHFVLAPLREKDLEIRLEEYTPVGLVDGLIYQT